MSDNHPTAAALPGPSTDGSRPPVAIAGRRVAKRFGHVQALVDASVTVASGEIVALFGDNGAGKSTLLKSLLGIHQPDSGEVVIGDTVAHLTSIRDAQAAGVDCVHQDLALAPDLSVIDNMFLGHEVVGSGLGRRLGVLRRKAMSERAEAALERLGIKLPSLTTVVRDLSGGQRQAMAIARAVMWARTAVLMDEPTAALGVKQSDLVCELMQAVAAQGLGVLVVSHDLPRVMKVADRVTILWRGRTVLDGDASKLTVPDAVAKMVGYEAVAS